MSEELPRSQPDVVSKRVFPAAVYDLRGARGTTRARLTRSETVLSTPGGVFLPGSAPGAATKPQAKALP